MNLCKRCNKEHDGSFGSGTFCSRACANKRVYTDDKKRLVYAKVSLKMKGKPYKINGIAPNKKARINVISNCKICNTSINNEVVDSITKKKLKSFCSDLCYKANASIAGRNSAVAQAESRRSKNESFFASLCQEKFNDVKTNCKMFNGWDADIVIEDYKLAVLWNGKWHYEKLTQKHSVEQVQNRDKIKLKEIANVGYTAYVIKDMGSFNPAFVNAKFRDLVNWLSQVPHKD
jgi:G:T-mismatch repair DNA endonuclease (very short patch repair protein)